MQGHVLSPTTRQEIHLITCEAEDGGVWGADRGGLCSPSTLPGRGWGGEGGWGTMAVGKEKKERGRTDTVKKAREEYNRERQNGGCFQSLPASSVVNLIDPTPPVLSVSPALTPSIEL